MYDSPGIFKDHAVLNDEHVPVSIIDREEQIKKLRFCLAPALKRQKPTHAWLYGGPGTGKTIVAKYVLGKLAAESGLAGSYVNCWQHSTFYSVLEKIISDLRLLMAEKVSVPFKLEALQRYVAKKPFVVVLDEIDQPQPRERASMLYNLCSLENVGIVCICNSRLPGRLVRNAERSLCLC